MHDKLRILLITDEVWNDQVHANNVLTSWFDGFNGEFASIYCSPGRPLNRCCTRYFQITDMMMLISLVTRKKAGVVATFGSTADFQANENLEHEHQKIYAFLKHMANEPLRALRELLWMCGRYDIDKLKHFIDSFQPDIIFCPRKASLKLLRLEKIVKSISQKPMIAFTGDDECSLKQFSFSPVFWIMRFLLRRKIREHMRLYSYMYTHSEEQGAEYRKTYGIETKVLHKCRNNQVKPIIATTLNQPIKLVYAGKLYCGRWKVLAEIAKGLKEINSDRVKMVMDIYTRDHVSRRVLSQLDDGKNVLMKGPVSPDSLDTIFNSADILLHVESFDLRNRLLTRHSFSTKIVDCLGSGRAVMAVCWSEHAGYIYLRRQDAAICISDLRSIITTLQSICAHPELIIEYAQKAADCVARNHRRGVVQREIYRDFQNTIGVASRS